MRILVVEDDPLLGDAVRAGLAQAGFAPDWVRDGVAADAALSTTGYDAVVLDLGLPRRDGLAVLKGLRQRGAATPVLILTARDTVEDRIGGLDAGADDYLVKPFDMGELTARLRALIRRNRGQAQPTLSVGGVVVDPAAHTVAVDGVAVDLSAREFALLHALMLGAGRVLSREQLETHLYPWGEETGSNTIDVHIHHLRKKLGREVIRTIRGVGYVVPK